MFSVLCSSGGIGDRSYGFIGEKCGFNVLLDMVNKGGFCGIKNGFCFCLDFFLPLVQSVMFFVM